MNGVWNRSFSVDSYFRIFFIIAILLFSSQTAMYSCTSSPLSKIGSDPSHTLSDDESDHAGQPDLRDRNNPRTPDVDMPNLFSDLRISLHMGDTSDKTSPSASSTRGETREFIVSGGNTITAELKKTGENCYLYVEEGYLFFPDDIVGEFDDSIYPELSTIMGTPGDIDGDARIYILYYNMGNNGIAGYFHPNDPNRLDLLYLNLYYDPGKMVVSHELIHQIQNNYDKAEERWIDEGLAEMAKIHLYGEPRSNSFMEHFENLPSISLNWKSYSNLSYINWAQYGIAYVFQQYIYDQFEGLDSSGLILRDGFSFDTGANEKYQGIEGINNFFNLTGSPPEFNSFFCNWTVANLLNNDNIGEGTWGYSSMDISVQPTVSVKNGALNESREIRSYAPCYIHVNRTARPLTVLINAGEGMSLAIVSRSNESSRADMVDIIELAAGENEFILDTDDSRWKDIILDVINHKNADEIFSFEISEIPLKPPVAVAGENMTVTEGEEIIFNASASFHPEEIEIVRYRWDFQNDGIFDSEGMVAKHTYYEPGDYTVLLQIVDNFGNEAQDTLELTVHKINNPPEIEVWLSKKQPLIFENVTIDASNTTDPDGDIMDFDWDFGENGNSNDIGPSPSVFFSIPGRNLIVLNVSDKRGMFTTKEIVVYVKENSMPVAIAPGDMSVNQDESFVLEDEGSYDIDGHFLTYEWTDGEITKYGKMVNWEFSSRGRFPMNLHVRDELGGADKDLFYVKVNGPPMIKIEHPSEIKVRESVILDAGGTRDPEGDRLEFSWTVGGTELAGENDDRLEYVFTQVGPTSVTLNVRDSYGARSSKRLNITVAPQPELKKLILIIPKNGAVFTDKIGFKGGNGGNEELDAVYIVVDNGNLRAAVDISGVGDWSSWVYTLEARMMALGPHTINVYGTIGDRTTPVAEITVYVEEPEEKKVPERYPDDHSTDGNEEIVGEKITLDYYIYAIPVGAFIFLILIVGILVKRRRDHRKELKKLLEELLA